MRKIAGERRGERNGDGDRRRERERDRGTRRRKRRLEEEARRGGTASRKQSGHRPLKILLRIVCHFTSERFRGEDGERVGAAAAALQPRTSIGAPNGVTLWPAVGFQGVYPF
ncbi:hypothetical protein KM043_017947 [Ampulex compressa]|nr:hypothetical protein KM043_017947 [Ampulex compressa]